VAATGNAAVSLTAPELQPQNIADLAQDYLTAGIGPSLGKLGLSFWDYLGDRLHRHGAIPPLPDLVRERAAATLAPP